MIKNSEFGRFIGINFLFHFLVQNDMHLHKIYYDKFK